MKPSQRRKKTHMDKIYELQHLNGHFTRLWNETKTTIDNKTPRSFYLNPKSSHYRGKIPAGRSKSADGKQNGLDKTSNLDLHRRILNGQKKLEMRRTEFAPVDNLTGNLMAKRYERRFLEADIMDKNFYQFAQPQRAFEPRTLLTNFAQPKIVKSRNYQPPIFHRRNRLSDSIKTKENLNATWNGNGGPKKDENLWTGSPEPARSLSPPISIYRERTSPNLLRYSPRLSTTTRTRSVLSRKSPHRREDDELKYYQFIQEVTKDIIDRGVYSDRVLENIIANHLERRKNDLNTTRMRQMLTKLLDDLGVSQDGLFSTHAEKASHPENVHFDPESFAREEENRRREWQAGDALRLEDSAQNQKNVRTALDRSRKLSSDQLEELYGSEPSVSLDDQDIDDILEGRNIDRLIARSKKPKTLNKMKTESPKREQSFAPSMGSVSKRSESIAQSSNGAANAAAAKNKSDQSAKSEWETTPTEYESGQSDDEKTLGDEVSELEDDDAEKSKSSEDGNNASSSSSARSPLTSKSDPQSSSDGSSSISAPKSRSHQTESPKTNSLTKRIIVANSIAAPSPPMKKLSQYSRMSSQESFRVEATPPKKLSENSDEDAFDALKTTPLKMSEFPVEDITIRTPSIEENDSYSDSKNNSSAASEIEDRNASSERSEKGEKHDDYGSEVEEEKEIESANRVQRVSANVPQRGETVHGKEVHDNKKTPSHVERINKMGLSHDNHVPSYDDSAAEDVSLQQNKLQSQNNEINDERKMSQELNKQRENRAEEEEERKQNHSDNSHLSERRVSGASDSEHLLSDTHPDRELLRQRRDSFLKQLEQQKTAEKDEENEKSRGGAVASPLGSERVDDPPFGASPTHENETTNIPHETPPPVDIVQHESEKIPPTTAENPVSPQENAPPVAAPRQIDNDSPHPERNDSISLPHHEVKPSAPPEEDADASDNAFESEKIDREDSASSDEGDGSVDIYAKDPTGQDFDESDSYYPPLSPITEVPETPFRKEMELLHGSMDSTRSLKQGFDVHDAIRSMKPPVPAPRRISNSSYGSYEHDRFALDDVGATGDEVESQRVSVAAVRNSRSDALKATDSQISD